MGRIILKGSYDKNNDKVYITWKGLSVMNILNISSNYDVDGLSEEELVKQVIEDNRKNAEETVNDYRDINELDCGE